ncbi:MAG: response regulator [Pseudomonadota bacterium]
MRHKLLLRQMRLALGTPSDKTLQERLAALRARGETALADEVDALLADGATRYRHAGRGANMSSERLISANDQLRIEAARQRSAAREALAATEAANRRILDSLREIVFQTDLQGNWVYLNPAWTSVTGYPVEQSLGQRALGFVEPQDVETHVAGLNALSARERDFFREQMRFRCSRGAPRWLEVFATRIEDEGGRMLGLSGSLADVTEQKLAQDRLIASEERLNQALRATDSRLWDWDLTRPQPYVDPAWMAYLGHRPDEAGLAAIEWHRQLHPQDLPRWRAHLREHLLRLRPELDIELRFATAHGDWRYAALRGKVVAWDGPRALRLAGTLQDISGRKEAEEAVLRQQELTEQILDQLPIPVFLKDREGRFVRFNRRFQVLSKRTRAEILGHKIEDFASTGWAVSTLREDAQAWSSGQMVTTERRLTNVDPPIDLLIMRIVINSGGQSYLLGFSIDISEQRAARDAMARAVESAEAASRAKSEFLANMSHEIRTPMNGILGMTELVLESDLSGEQREDIGLVKASAGALLTIINDILDFSKIEAGKLDIEEVPFEPATLALETVRAMWLRAQQKSLELVCEIAPELPRTMKGDPGRLRQVLINLLGNAIKFTESGKVVLSLAAGPEIDGRMAVRFAVRDTGIGIAPEKQKMIFDAFSQVDGSTTRQYGGTGLGLTICRRLVILMQGEMEVTSAPGSGSTFSFTVPLRRTSAQAAQPLSWMAGKTALLGYPDDSGRHLLAALLARAGLQVRECASAEQAHQLLAQARPDLLVLGAGMLDLASFARARMSNRAPLLWIGEDGDAAEPDARLERAPSAAALTDAVLQLVGVPFDAPQELASIAGRENARAPHQRTEADAHEDANAAQTGLRILLAEDNPVNQRLALRLLEKMGHRITLVDNGVAALERAVQGGFDLVLMDVQMPGLDGLSATRHIRQWEQSHGGHVPIIAMTARAMAGDRESCIEAGMDDYLSKPIDSARLRQLVAQFDPEQQEPVLAWRGALQRLDGDTDLLLELAALFLDDGPAMLALLREALGRQDVPASQRAVHSLKGVLVNFGAQRAITQLERLSASLHDGRDAAQWPARAEALAPALDEVYGALRELIAAGAPP